MCAFIYCVCYTGQVRERDSALCFEVARKLCDFVPSKRRAEYKGVATRCLGAEMWHGTGGPAQARADARATAGVASSAIAAARVTPLASLASSARQVAAPAAASADVCAAAAKPRKQEKQGSAPSFMTLART